ncbi:hypothetical protein B0T13DRAFT_445067 [Neurospora crassa]|nr:hypothetical protein B0T13DRAFT_445067 [Neurospora crassa]
MSHITSFGEITGDGKGETSGQEGTNIVGPAKTEGANRRGGTMGARRRGSQHQQDRQGSHGQAPSAASLKPTARNHQASRSTMPLPSAHELHLPAQYSQLPPPAHYYRPTRIPTRQAFVLNHHQHEYRLPHPRPRPRPPLALSTSVSSPSSSSSSSSSSPTP